MDRERLDRAAPVDTAGLAFVIQTLAAPVKLQRHISLHGRKKPEYFFFRDISHILYNIRLYALIKA